MYCRHCGKQLPDEAVVCPECGTHTDSTTITPHEAQSNNTAPETKKSFFNSMGIVGFVLSVYAFVTYILSTLSYYGSSYISSIIPAALTGISLGIIGIRHAKGSARVLAIVGLALSGLLILIAIITQIVHLF